VSVNILFMDIKSEIRRRRTFAIISHPDAGKTTLTEKLLLFGGAIQTAGAVRSNKIRKTTTSDFMEIEKQRGISVSTSVMAFDYNNIRVNILDTPGHKDFAEDTYRTLSAVDRVIILMICWRSWSGSLKLLYVLIHGLSVMVNSLKVFITCIKKKSRSLHQTKQVFQKA